MIDDFKLLKGSPEVSDYVWSHTVNNYTIKLTCHVPGMLDVQLSYRDIFIVGVVTQRIEMFDSVGEYVNQSQTLLTFGWPNYYSIKQILRTMLTCLMQVGRGTIELM